MSKKILSVEDYLRQLEPSRRQTLKTLDRLIVKRYQGLAREMWHSMSYHIIGYGQVHYRYASGRQGDWFIIGLAAHKSYLSLYVCGQGQKGYLLDDYRGKLGRVNAGKGCLRFKNLEDINLETLTKLLDQAVKQAS